MVVYFFPAADSTDCSIEAHAFAEAIDQFAALGATVIGVSADDIDTLAKFSVKSCQSRFPVASDEAKTVIEGFDALMQTRPDFANRLSYVIAPSGKVAYYYQNLNPDKHVERMLNALARPTAAAERRRLPAAGDRFSRFPPCNSTTSATKTLLPLPAARCR